MAIIGENIILGKTLVGNIARNQMESKMELMTKGALYVGTGDKNSVTPDGGGDKVPIPVTSHIAPSGASDDGKVLVAASNSEVGWIIEECPKATTATTAEKAAGYSQGGEIEAELNTIKTQLAVLEALVNIKKAKIYGVDKVGSENPDDLVRTDDAVGLNFTTNHAPTGYDEITSDFDNCYPWCDIEEVTDDFENVFIKIPKFYSKITKNSDGTYLHQLSGIRRPGFDTLFKVGNREIDYVMVGKYEGSGSSSRVYSKWNQTVLTKLTLDDYRTACRAYGEGYQQYDFLIDLIIKELWLVEMKTTNCQSIMAGYTDGDKAIVTGETKYVKTPSGSNGRGDDGKHAFIYRGIENLWGNIQTWCDGISFNNRSVYVCTDPTSYKTGETTAPYVYQGQRPQNDGYVKKVEVLYAPHTQNSLIQYATEVGGSATTYFCDSCDEALVGVTLVVGGYFRSSVTAGLWCWDGSYGSSTSNDLTGGRLCYKPL